MFDRIPRVCVIGSGFAGTFLALELVEKGVETLLLEAGGRVTPETGAPTSFPLRAFGDAVPSLEANRTIALGGTSHRWSGVVSRFAAEDFQSRSEFGFGSDWPLSPETLAPYYTRAERRLCTHGGPVVPGAEPEREASYPVEWPADLYVAPVGAARRGCFPLAFATRQGAPLRLADEELPRFAASPYGTLMTARPVTRLVVGADGRVDHVEARRPDGAVETFRAEVYVVAAGVAETARLLLASVSRRHPCGLGNHLGLVGRYLHGHPRFRQEVRRHRDDARAGGVFRTLAWADPLRREGLGAAVVDFNYGGAVPAIDVTAELEPTRENRLFLDPSWHDAWGRPGLVAACDASARDRRTMARARGLLAELVRESQGEVDERSAAAATSLSWFHPAGSCRMATRPEQGVVDPTCRVFGCGNLYLAGAAVFPTSGPANPTLTVVALALRLADHLSTSVA